MSTKILLIFKGKNNLDNLDNLFTKNPIYIYKSIWGKV
nr:MAG TPA: 60S ribosomal protein L8 [Caudoviricetes sp.]